MTLMEIINNYTYRVIRSKDNISFTGQCAEISITSTGKTKEEALMNIKQETLNHIKKMDKKEIPIPFTKRER